MTWFSRPPPLRRPGNVEGSWAEGPVARVSTVFTGCGDARARAFDAQSGALQRVFRGHALIINCIQVGAPSSCPLGPAASTSGDTAACDRLPWREWGRREGARVPTPPALHQRQHFLAEAEVLGAEVSPSVCLRS